MKKFFANIFRFKDWADWDRNISIFQYLKQVIWRLFVPKNPVSAKKFDVVVKQLKLSDEALNEQVHALRRLCYIFITIALLVDFYAIYLLTTENWFRALVVFCISCISFGFAFRYHFYSTLIKYKRLDCSLKDWYQLNFKKIDKHVKNL